MNETSEQPTTAPGLSAEEAKKYVEELRSTPAEEILTDILLSAINAAQVKLGREDARIFIDLSVALLDSVRGRVPDEFAKQVEQAVGQLRLAQVQAEADVTSRDTPTDRGSAPTDRGSAPAGPRGTDAPPSSQAGPSKLWIPGRD